MSDVTNFVPEPTIDEMLELLDAAFSHLAGGDLYVDEHYGGTLDRTSFAIRAILEQHRNDGFSIHGYKITKDPQIELETIRAFVERVEKRLPDYDTGRGADSWLKEYRRAVYSELEAMEAE